jgi:ribosomal protein L37E
MSIANRYIDITCLDCGNKEHRHRGTKYCVKCSTERQKKSRKESANKKKLVDSIYKPF